MSLFAKVLCDLIWDTFLDELVNGVTRRLVILISSFLNAIALMKVLENPSQISPLALKLKIVRLGVLNALPTEREGTQQLLLKILA